MKKSASDMLASLSGAALPCDNEIYKRLCRAREFIDDCFEHELDLRQISRQAFFSPYHFLRLFRQAFHQTPHQYLIARRIEKAKDLLAAGDLSVTEICLKVGFQSLGSFSSLFRKQVGVPPTCYRSQMYPRFHIAVLYPEIAIPACFLMMFAPPPANARKQFSRSIPA